ncbi:MAG: hypothetical protein WA056_09090 [Gallionella sp.]
MTKKHILIGFIAAIVFMMLFPPFAFYFQGGGLKNEGYHFILSTFENSDYATINVGVLAIQFVAVTLIASALWLYLDTKDK